MWFLPVLAGLGIVGWLFVNRKANAAPVSSEPVSSGALEAELATLHPNTQMAVQILLNPNPASPPTLDAYTSAIAQLQAQGNTPALVEALTELAAARYQAG